MNKAGERNLFISFILLSIPPIVMFFAGMFVVLSESIRGAIFWVFFTALNITFIWFFSVIYLTKRGKKIRKKEEIRGKERFYIEAILCCIPVLIIVFSGLIITFLSEISSAEKVGIITMCTLIAVFLMGLLLIERRTR